MVPIIANDNLGNVVSLEDHRKPVDTRAMEFFDSLSDEYLGINVAWVSVNIIYRDENGEPHVKEYRL